jgi:hypothetical protein
MRKASVYMAPTLINAVHGRPISCNNISILNVWSHASPQTITAQTSISVTYRIYSRYQLWVEWTVHDRTECSTSFKLICELSYILPVSLLLWPLPPPPPPPPKPLCTQEVQLLNVLLWTYLSSCFFTNVFNIRDIYWIYWLHGESKTEREREREREIGWVCLCVCVRACARNRYAIQLRHSWLIGLNIRIHFQPTMPTWF